MYLTETAEKDLKEKLQTLAREAMKIVGFLEDYDENRIAGTLFKAVKTIHKAEKQLWG
jgi:hypothetical protein